jgi:hypothetical protein
MAVDVLPDAVAGELADDPPATARTATDACNGGAKTPTASPAPPRLSRVVAVDVRCHDTIIGARTQDLLTRRG